MTDNNTVYFVGCGPGDPELITLKAMNLMHNADVIIYSGSLINPRILEFAKKDAIL
ncbi:MAG TPA: SAM-dependent methyltransferase, partial [Nitrososphaeraceae archaeon]|nr:SAM-dependent methyltransferase [Nitrososphaeraceae archaeon]